MAAKSVAQKLLIRPGSSVWMSHPDRSDLLGEMPEAVTSASSLAAADVAVVLVDDEAGLRAFAEVNRELSGRRGRCGCSTPRATASPSTATPSGG